MEPASKPYPRTFLFLRDISRMSINMLKKRILKLLKDQRLSMYKEKIKVDSLPTESFTEKMAKHTLSLVRSIKTP